MENEPIIHIKIEAPTLDALKAFTDETSLDFGCRPIARQVGERYVIQAFLPETELTAARNRRSSSNVTITVMENATEVGRQRQQEVGRGNRFATRNTLPRGLGGKE